MKIKLILAASLFAHCAAVADQGEAVTLRTLSGKTYRGVTIAKVDPDGVCFRHSNGAGKILFSDMPSDLRHDFGYDAKKAAAYEKDIETRKEKARTARIERDREVAKAHAAAYEAAAAQARLATAAEYRVAAVQGAGMGYGAIPWGLGGYGLGFAGGFFPGDLGYGGTLGGAAYCNSGYRTGYAIGSLPGRCAPVHEYGSAARIGISTRGYAGYGYNYGRGAPVHEYGRRLGYGNASCYGGYGYGTFGGGYVNGGFRQPYSPVAPGGRLTNGVPSLGAGFSPSPAISAPGGGGAMFSAGR